MQSNHTNLLLNCFIIVALLMVMCAALAFYVNSRRPDDDPKKKNYHPFAVLFAPITFPLFIVIYAFIFLLKVVLYGIFLLLFAFALIFIRKPFMLEWLKKIALTIGNLLLDANTLVVRIFLQPLARSSESA